MAQDYVTILQGVLSAAASALNEAEVPPGRVELVPGVQAAWDDCCEGQLYLRVIEIYPSAGQGTAFPAIDTRQAGVGAQCGFHMVAVRIGLGVIRCAATQDDDGRPPTPAQVSADGERMLEDMALLLDVLMCAQNLGGIHVMKMDRWMPQGVQGGCHGGEWGAYLGIDPCLSPCGG